MFKKSLLLLTFSILAFLIANTIQAQTSRTFSLPSKAREVAPNVYSLGKAKDPQTNKMVEGYAIIHKKEGFHHRPDHAKGPGGGNDKGESKCYDFLSKGAKWKGDPEGWVVNPDNTDELSLSYVADQMNTDVDKWEAAAGKTVLGDGVQTSTILSVDTEAPDGSNEVMFGSISDSGAIAVTIVWGYFSGPPGHREIIEWDMLFDQVDFKWTADASVEPTKMDFENISTHELGHSMGLADLYTSDCSEETMYGYATEGEIKKRDLHAGDIAGMSDLY